MYYLLWPQKRRSAIEDYYYNRIVVFLALCWHFDLYTNIYCNTITRHFNFHRESNGK
jgi:hypothetical protein